VALGSWVMASETAGRVIADRATDSWAAGSWVVGLTAEQSRAVEVWAAGSTIVEDTAKCWRLVVAFVEVLGVVGAASPAASVPEIVVRHFEQSIRSGSGESESCRDGASIDFAVSVEHVVCVETRRPGTGMETRAAEIATATVC